MKNIITRYRERITIYLSHRPKLYALIVGIGIVLFWRGTWHSIDFIHTYFNFYQNNPTIGAPFSVWWDGPLSLAVGVIILYFSGAFISSFIGNELILAGLRGEKRISQKVESEVKTEIESVSEIKDGLKNVNEKIRELEEKLRNKEIDKKAGS